MHLQLPRLAFRVTFVRVNPRHLAAQRPVAAPVPQPPDYEPPRMLCVTRGVARLFPRAWLRSFVPFRLLMLPSLHRPPASRAPFSLLLHGS